MIRLIRYGRQDGHSRDYSRSLINIGKKRGLGQFLRKIYGGLKVPLLTYKRGRVLTIKNGKAPSPTINHDLMPSRMRKMRILTKGLDEQPPPRSLPGSRPLPSVSSIEVILSGGMGKILAVLKENWRVFNLLPLGGETEEDPGD